MDVAHNPSLLYTKNESMKKAPYITLAKVINFFDMMLSIHSLSYPPRTSLIP